MQIDGYLEIVFIIIINTDWIGNGTGEKDYIIQLFIIGVKCSRIINRYMLIDNGTIDDEHI